MRYCGKIVKWNEKRGFGFIEYNEGDQVFVHISHVSAFQTFLDRGTSVEFEIVPDERSGRTRADAVTVIG